MPKRIPQLIGVLLLGVVSSLIAWEFTVNWKWATVSVIILIVAAGALVSMPAMFTNVFLRLNHSGIQRIYLSQYAAQKDIKSVLSQNVREIDVLTIRGFGIFALKDSLIYKKVAEANPQLRIRILLLDPASSSCRQRAIEIGEAEPQFVERLNTAIGAVKELREFQTHNIECRLYDRLPIWRIVRIDDCMFVSSFLPQLEGHMTTMYCIHRGSPLSLFPSFRRQFDDVWDASAKKTV